MSKLGDNLRSLREYKFISQTKLAKKLNISNKSLSVYERGISLPDINVLISFADFFDVSLDNLVGRYIPPKEVSPEDLEFIGIIKLLNPVDKKILKDLAKTFLERAEAATITKSSKKM